MMTATIPTNSDSPARGCRVCEWGQAHQCLVGGCRCYEPSDRPRSGLLQHPWERGLRAIARGQGEWLRSSQRVWPGPAGSYNVRRSAVSARSSGICPAIPSSRISRLCSNKSSLLPEPICGSKPASSRRSPELIASMASRSCCLCAAPITLACCNSTSTSPATVLAIDYPELSDIISEGGYSEEMQAVEQRARRGA
jgi:hypothetical protein